jgi:hypothetical protein
MITKLTLLGIVRCITSPRLKRLVNRKITVPDPVSAVVRGVARVLALLAVAGQLLIGAAIPAWATLAADGPLDGIPICHTAEPASSDSKAPAGSPVHHGDCALCPVCHALAAMTALPTPPAPVPPPSLVVGAGAALLPPARAPPASPVLTAAYPTGPPPAV